MTERKKNAELNFRAIQRIWSMLPQKFKAAAIRLWLLMVVGALLEMLGVSLVIPVITVLTQPDMLSRHESLSKCGRPDRSGECSHLLSSADI